MMNISTRDYYDHLYLSPHFDDVALSCGGRVCMQTSAGDTVLVVTVATVEPPDDLVSATVESLHDRWRAGLPVGDHEMSIVARRQAEDRRAFAILQADILHLPFLDCIYRVGADSSLHYPGPVDMFGPIVPADTGMIDQLAGVFAGLPPAGRVYVPLGVGGHVDHQLTRLAAEQVFPAPSYYEDYPYTMRPGALEEVLPPAEREDWTSEVLRLTPVALAAKIEAVAAYESQLSSFFSGYDDLVEKLREEGQRVLATEPLEAEPSPAGGERLWRRRAIKQR
jgi:LmbE family N-acetylglucosaminyl deacetylase